MFSFLRPASPKRSQTAHQTHITYENGASSAEFHPASSEFLMTASLPAGNTLADGTRTFHAPPSHYHAHQLERFAVLEGAARFTVDGAEVVKRAGERVDVPAGAYHSFVNDSGDARMALAIVFEPADRAREEGFFRNFFGYAEDCRAAGRAPSVFQMERMLMRIDCPVGVVPAFLPLAVRRRLDWGLMVLLGKVVGEWCLGYKESYVEYYDPEGKKST